MDTTVKRGDIYYADLSPVVGSEQGGTRPVLIVQNDTGNRHSPTVIAAAITSQTGKARLPTHINIPGGSVGLSAADNEYQIANETAYARVKEGACKTPKREIVGNEL